MRTDDNADAKRILIASPPADWRKQLGRPRITWLSIVQQDLKQHLTLPEAADSAQNRPLWRMMLPYCATQSELHARNDDDDTSRPFDKIVYFAVIEYSAVSFSTGCKHQTLINSALFY